MPRYRHTATLLTNGKVLIAGGLGNLVNSTNSVELYDPPSGTFTLIAPMNHPRENASATLLPNGKVLVAGGFSTFSITNTAELYDPVSGTWSFTDLLPVGVSQHPATLLPNGKVLVAGGVTPGGAGSALPNAELYNPATGKWTATASMNADRLRHRLDDPFALGDPSQIVFEIPWRDQKFGALRHERHRFLFCRGFDSL